MGSQLEDRESDDVIDRLRAEVEALRAERDALASKRAICLYCGETFVADEVGLARHVMDCEKRPERVLMDERDTARSERDAANALLDGLERMRPRDVALYHNACQWFMHPNPDGETYPTARAAIEAWVKANQEVTR